MKKQSSWYQDIKVARILAFLPKNILDLIKHIKYLKLPYKEKIIKLKNKFDKKTCFIIGNGPSLSPDDLTKIKNYYSFAVNKIYYIFNQTSWRPNFYVSVDKRTINECYDKMKNEKTICFFDYSVKNNKSYSDSNNIYLINNRQRFYLNRFKKNRLFKFSKDISNCVEAGETVIYNAIQIAAYMGFKKIILLGVDFNYSKVFSTNGNVKITSDNNSYFSHRLDEKNENVSNIIGQNCAFRSAKIHCKNYGISIYNSTRNSKLELFDFISLEELIENEK